MAAANDGMVFRLCRGQIVDVWHGTSVFTCPDTLASSHINRAILGPGIVCSDALRSAKPQLPIHRCSSSQLQSRLSVLSTKKRQNSVGTESMNNSGNTGQSFRKLPVPKTFSYSGLLVLMNLIIIMMVDGLVVIYITVL